MEDQVWEAQAVRVWEVQVADPVVQVVCTAGMECRHHRHPVADGEVIVEDAVCQVASCMY
ncbi:MAG: hypothetical protein LUD01_07000 [Clostridiales bacterium]|nr:hypothetical protein [Clostridiales bacterium]